MRKWSVLFFLLFMLIGSLNMASSSFAACEILSYGFSSTSGWTTYQDTGHWTVSNGMLNVQDIGTTSTYASTAFQPSTFFSVDVDIAIVSTTSESDRVGVRIYSGDDVFVNGDSGEHRTNGVLCYYYPNTGLLKFKVYDFDTNGGEWVIPLAARLVPVTVDSVESIGLSMVADGVIFRVNKQDTTYKLSGDFSGNAYNAIDTLRLFAGGSGLHARFDNVCASPRNQVQGSKHQLNIEMNADVNIPDTSFGCSLSVVPGTVSGNVDLYVAIVLPGGELYLLGPTTLETGVVACKTNIPAPRAAMTILPEFPMPAALPNGTYTFLALLVRAGTDLADEQNWMSNVATRSMFFNPLSPAQQAFIDELGYPLQFVKFFSHDGSERRIDETWIYLKQGLGENFINGVFVHEKVLENSIADAPQGVNHPERYHMDTSLSQIKSWHGEPKKTFTENLDIGVHSTYVYDGIIFGFLDAQLISVVSGK